MDSCSATRPDNGRGDSRLPPRHSSPSGRAQSVRVQMRESGNLQHLVFICCRQEWQYFYNLCAIEGSQRTYAVITA